MSTLFISDLHLDPERPDITAAFVRFIHEQARSADALFILGDLFEAWVGDDDPSAAGALVAETLGGLRDAGVPVYFIRGNRDFLLGDAYAKRAGVRILQDPSVVMLHGTPTLLLHGDTLCSDDVAYQQFRTQTRNADWQRQFLAQPLAVRTAFAQQARAASQDRQSQLKARGAMDAITDASPATVEATFARFGVNTMIHGHTHRPAMHAHRGGRRVVLGDWYEQGSVLRVDEQDLHLSSV